MYSMRLGTQSNIGAEAPLRTIGVTPRGWTLAQWGLVGAGVIAAILAAVFAGLAWKAAHGGSGGSIDCCRANNATLHVILERLDALSETTVAIEGCTEEIKAITTDTNGDVAALQETADSIETTVVWIHTTVNETQTTLGEVQATADWIHKAVNMTLYL